MLSKAKSSNVGPPTNPAMQLAQKIPFINPEKIILGVNNVCTNIRL